MSIGGGYYAPVNNLLEAIYNGGITTVVAAGNSNINAASTSPASAPDAITVGASDFHNYHASFSNYGAGLDIFGPGVTIYSSNYGCDTCYSYKDGTSMGMFSLLLVNIQNEQTY
jgi:subtilisin family serine protease